METLIRRFSPSWEYELVDGELGPFISMTYPGWEGAITITPEGGGRYGVEKSNSAGHLVTLRGVRPIEIVPTLVFDKFFGDYDHGQPLQAT